MNTNSQTKTQKELENRKAAQHAYAVARTESKELAKKISRAILDQKVTGDWAAVGSQEHYNEILNDLLDQINGTGEYAK